MKKIILKKGHLEKSEVSIQLEKNKTLYSQKELFAHIMNNTIKHFYAALRPLALTDKLVLQR